ncbi:MAG: RNA degradosome polyphosphate kinase, partial [Bacteroidaceae bacterium]
MENVYQYFKRDISWLSFNYRVLLEADDDNLPLYERINFISIYSSNLEEFYKIRVAEHKAVVSGAKTDEESIQESEDIIEKIAEEVNNQMEERIRIYEHKILPALKDNHIIFYQSRTVEEFHKEFVRNFFKEEIFPYLQPVLVSKNKIITFLRDNRLYLAVRLFRLDYKKGDKDSRIQYFVMKLPYSKVPRFIQLPAHEDNYYLMFIEDIIKANLDRMFPGYEVDCSYCIKISRDADILIDDAMT